MTTRYLPIGAALLLSLSVTPVLADVGAGLRIGTLGAGAELTKSFSNRFSLGLGVNTFNFETDDRTSDIEYDFDFNLRSVALLANFHPFAGAFRFTGGVVYNKNELDLTGKPTASSYTINGQTYTAAEVGTLTGQLTFNTTAPYVGIGWGNRPGRKLGVTADIGALYQGSPKLALSATGALSDPALAADLELERREAEQELSDYKWYPVLSLGMYFRF